MFIFESYGDFLREKKDLEIKLSEINEGTTPMFKKLIKKAKELGIETADELRDLIADMPSDGYNFISGADYEIAKKRLKIKESVNESIDSKVRSKIVVALKSSGINHLTDYDYKAGQFIAKDKSTAEKIESALDGKFRVKAYYDRVNKNGGIPMMIVK